jgi:hypothetical protein
MDSPFTMKDINEMLYVRGSNKSLGGIGPSSFAADTDFSETKFKIEQDQICEKFIQKLSRLDLALEIDGNRMLPIGSR